MLSIKIVTINQLYLLYTGKMKSKIVQLVCIRIVFFFIKNNLYFKKTKGNVNSYYLCFNYDKVTIKDYTKLLELVIYFK